MCFLSYGCHQCALIYLFARTRRDRTPLTLSEDRSDAERQLRTDDALPHVTVQIPIYNERFTVHRIVHAVSALDYPADRLQIQILDDSTDDTRTIAQQAVEHARQAGTNITLIHRDNRMGYKAGALEAGLASATGEFIAIFDADFVPPKHVIRRIICDDRVFDDPRVGFVQTRWSYLNRNENFITRAQALMMDMHFFIEQPARNRNGLMINFNGSGGMWRRECIRNAGGWQHDTLTEDLDLSYRAEIKGWRGVYIPDIEAPNDLPSDVTAFKRQQRRWSRGSAQCVRKLIPRIIASHLTHVQKLAAVLHVTGYFLHPLMLLTVIVWPPLLLHFDSLVYLIVVQTLLTVIGVGPILGMYIAQRLQGRTTWQFLKDLPGALALGLGISFANSIAVATGLFSGKSGEFERTPKRGGNTTTDSTPAGHISGPHQAETKQSPTMVQSYKLPLHWTILGEIGLAAYSFITLAVLLDRGLRFWALPMISYGCVFTAVVIMQLSILCRSARQMVGNIDTGDLVLASERT